MNCERLCGAWVEVEREPLDSAGGGVGLIGVFLGRRIGFGIEMIHWGLVNLERDCDL